MHCIDIISKFVSVERQQYNFKTKTKGKEMEKQMYEAIIIAQENEKLRTHASIAVNSIEEITQRTSTELYSEEDRKVLNKAIDVLEKLGLSQNELCRFIEKIV